MAAISRDLLFEAVRRVEHIPFAEREQLAFEVHGAQPNLLFSVLVLK
jgi:hypothetical protein